MSDQWTDANVKSFLDNVTEKRIPYSDALSLLSRVRDDFNAQSASQLNTIRELNDDIAHLDTQIDTLKSAVDSANKQIAAMTPDVTVEPGGIVSTSVFQTGFSDVDNKDLLYANPTARATAMANLSPVMHLEQNYLLGWGKSDPWQWDGTGTKPPAPTNWASLDACMMYAVNMGLRRVLNTQLIPWHLRGEWGQDGTTRPHTYADQWSDSGILMTSRVDDFKLLISTAADRYLRDPYKVDVIVTGCEFHGAYRGRDKTFNHYRYDDYPGTPGDNADMGMAYIHNIVVDVFTKKAVELGIDPAKLTFINNYPPLVVWGKGASYTVPIGHPLRDRIWGSSDNRGLEVLQKMIPLLKRVDAIGFDMSTGNKDGIYTTGMSDWDNLTRYDEILDYIISLNPGKKYISVEGYEKPYLDPGDNSALYRTAIRADVYRRYVQKGIWASLIWGITGSAMGGPGSTDKIANGALVTPTSTATGGQTKPMLQMVKLFHDYFSAGTPIRSAKITGNGVSVLLSDVKAMLINKTNMTKKVAINGDVFLVTPYACRVV